MLFLAVIMYYWTKMYLNTYCLTKNSKFPFLKFEPTTLYELNLPFRLSQEVLNYNLWNFNKELNSGYNISNYILLKSGSIVWLASTCYYCYYCLCVLLCLLPAVLHRTKKKREPSCWVTCFTRNEPAGQQAPQ